METGTLEKKIAKLPEPFKHRAEIYIDALLDEAKEMERVQSSNDSIKNRGYGSLKGKIWMAEDFDEPLEDFKGYM